jgi:hypothetical protein
MLTETGEHVFRLAFGGEAETTRNFIFGVVVTETPVVAEACGWDTMQDTRRCVYICYELCDAFPLCENSEEYNQLQQAVERILAVTVRLLPSTIFQRSIGIYPALHQVFRGGEFAGVFRDDGGSLLDVKMHAVLSRWESTLSSTAVLSQWESKLFSTPTEPPVSTSRITDKASRVPRDEWNTCFSSIACVYWYHAYVYDVIGEEIHEGFSESNVLRTYETVSGKGGADVRGKLALLDILKLVYRYNYMRA